MKGEEQTKRLLEWMPADVVPREYGGTATFGESSQVLPASTRTPTHPPTTHTPTYPPTYPPSRRVTYLPTFLPTFLPTYPPLPLSCHC